MQRPDITKMQKRLQAALTNISVLPRVHADLMHTFNNLGLNTERDGTIERILTDIIETTDLETTERKIYSELQRLKVDGVSVTDILDEKMKDRAHIIYMQVSKFFRQDESIIDWGCGDGQVTNHVYHHITHNIEGYDVRNYAASGIAVPIKQFDGEFIPVSVGFFDAGLMTNVAHHEANNTKILHELARIIRTGGRLVVIETVPVEDKPEEFERTFVGDYVYNRLFHQADVPVPGTYETEEGWVQRFAEVGFDLEELEGTANPTPLGYDQPTIRDWHTRLILRRNDRNRL